MGRQGKSRKVPRKPVIGVAASVPVDRKAQDKLRRYTVAIEQAGGEPLVLPLSTNRDTLRNAMDRAGALLITGGKDIRPGFYGEQAVPNVELNEESPLRVERDITCLKRAKEMGIPVLGICYGMQLLNVVEGGTLYQNVGADIEPFHRVSGEDYVEHEVTIERGTLLEKIFRGRRTTVRSSHHQAVKRPGADLIVSARCAHSDVIEAIEGPGTFFLGVQWHPERHEPQPDPIFVAFVQAALV